MRKQDTDHARGALTAREARQLRDLRRRRSRAQYGLFLAEGVRVVEDLLASALRVRWVVTSSDFEDGDRDAALAGALEERGIPRRAVSPHVLREYAGTDSPQGIIAVAEIPSAPAEILADARSPVLVLDGVQDPGNFGALVRSAEALGAGAVVALPGTVDPWNAKAVRSAAGSSFRVPIVALGWDAAAAALRGAGYALLGAAAEGRPIGGGRSDLAALVVGNEGAGLSAAVRAGVDELVGIPLRGRADSLNVAAAAAILLYELTR